jgi:hypothetical protein
MIPELPDAVTVEMAKREHRMRHVLWHGVRGNWSRLSSSAKQEIRDIDPEWEPPRPAFDANGDVLRDNDSGEDFLYMHRQMIGAVDDVLARVGDPAYPKVEGWERVPPPDDRDYPAPPLEGLEGVKSDEHYHDVLAPWERRYTSDDYLGSVTLGQLGSDLEFTVHNDMHMRWAAPSPVGYRPRTPLTQPVDTAWDDPAYDYLGDTYSSHVNPIFWKLHGWVDDRIEDWKRANGVVGPIQWKGTWVGPMSHARHQHRAMAAFTAARPEESEDDKLQRLAAVLSEATGFDGFFGFRPGGRIDNAGPER